MNVTDFLAYEIDNHSIVFAITINNGDCYLCSLYMRHLL